LWRFGKRSVDVADDDYDVDAADTVSLMREARALSRVPPAAARYRRDATRHGDDHDAADPHEQRPQIAPASQHHHHQQQQQQQQRGD